MSIFPGIHPCQDVCICKIKAESSFQAHGVTSCLLGPEPIPTQDQRVQHTEAGCASPGFTGRTFLGADLDKGVWSFVTGSSFQTYFTWNMEWEGRMPGSISVLPSKTSSIIYTNNYTNNVPAQQTAVTLGKSVVWEPHAALQQLKESFYIKKILRPWRLVTGSPEINPHQGKAQEWDTTTAESTVSLLRNSPKIGYNLDFCFKFLSKEKKKPEELSMATVFTWSSSLSSRHESPHISHQPKLPAKIAHRRAADTPMLKSKMYEVESNIWLNGFIFWHLPKNNWKKGLFVGYQAVAHTGKITKTFLKSL